MIKLFEQWLMEDDAQSAAQTTTTTTAVPQVQQNQYKITVTPPGAASFDVIGTSDAEYKTKEANSFKVISSTNTSVLPGQILAVGAEQNDNGTTDVMISSEPMDPEKALNFAGSKVSITKDQSATATQQPQ